MNVSENHLLPELNLVGTVGVASVEDNFGSSVSNLSDLNEVNVTFGAQFSYPLGNREAPQAMTSYNQALAELNKIIGMTLQRHNIVPTS